jgi:hypothetical protein
MLHHLDGRAGDGKVGGSTDNGWLQEREKALLSVRL